MGRGSGRGARKALDGLPLKKFVDQKLIDAISHPARAHVLATLNERIASPSEVAEEIGVDVKYLNYHFEELEKSGCIELVKTEQRRGATKHYYRAKETLFFNDREWEDLPPSLRIGFSTEWLQSIIDDAAKALRAGTFDARSDRHLSWTTLFVDEEGWRELNRALNLALTRMLAIREESAGRLERTGETAIPVTVGIASFEMPPRPAQRGSETAVTD